MHAVFTADDFRGKWHEMWPTLAGPDGPQPPPGCLADGDVRFVGDPIAIVIADNRYIAEDACDLVEVDFDVKTPVVDYEKAAADTENIVHKEWGTNVGMHIPAFGLGYDAPELQAIFDSAAHVAEQTIRQSRSSNVPMETRGISASWNPYDESLEVRVSTQNQSDYRACSLASSTCPSTRSTSSRRTSAARSARRASRRATTCASCCRRSCSAGR